MFAINYLFAKSYTRWMAMNRDHAGMVCQEWVREATHGRDKTNKGCYEYARWFGEQIEAMGIVTEHFGSLSIARHDESKPFSPENCAVVRRRIVVELNRLKAAGTYDNRSLSKLLFERS